MMENIKFTPNKVFHDGTERKEDGCIQNMDRGPWTTPWTTPNFQKEIAPVDMNIYPRSGYEKQILLTSLRVCLVIAGCFELKVLE